MTRQLRYNEAINEATDYCMGSDSRVYVMGLGATDPKGIFGTTTGLEQKYGADRVLDMPTAESGMTGIAIGSALVGMRPIMTHQRVEFAMLAMEQIVNQAAKWHYMFGGQTSVPIVIRLIIGRGWGQGPQHSQSLQAWFAHIPGLKVVMPATPHDAKGMLISSVEDNNPVVFLEHRWLHGMYGDVPEEAVRVPIGKARIAEEGTDLTIVATSYMVVEATRCARILEAEAGVKVEVVDVRTLRPLDEETILASVRKTGRLLVADTGWKAVGFSAEIIALAAEAAHGSLTCAPKRLGMLDCPVPTTPALANEVYPRVEDLLRAAGEMLGINVEKFANQSTDIRLDIPDPNFTGPF